MSREQLSRRLGYGPNVIYLWERQRRLPSAGVLFRMAELRRPALRQPTLRQPTLRQALLQFLGPATECASAIRAGDDITRVLLRWMCGDQSNVELAQHTGFDRSTLARWRAGKTQPRLSDFLALLDKTTLRLLDFVGLFVNPAELETTREAYAVAAQRQRLAYEVPWSAAVLHALDLAAYRAAPRHRPQLLAEHLGLPSAEVEAYLAQLAEARVIEKHDGLWREVRVLSIDTRSDFAKNRALKSHWTAVATDRLARLQPGHENLFSYNVFAISSADLAQLRELHLDYFQRVRQVVARATGADHVVVMNLQLFALDEQRPP